MSEGPDSASMTCVLPPYDICQPASKHPGSCRAQGPRLTAREAQVPRLLSSHTDACDKNRPSAWEPSFSGLHRKRWKCKFRKKDVSGMCPENTTPGRLHSTLFSSCRAVERTKEREVQCCQSACTQARPLGETSSSKRCQCPQSCQGVLNILL